jgi:acetamidase/formamidase
VGTTLFIPVHARGALFLAGDEHAGQDNGEVDITQLVDGNKGVHALIPKAIFVSRQTRNPQ